MECPRWMHVDGHEGRHSALRSLGAVTGGPAHARKKNRNSPGARQKAAPWAHPARASSQAMGP
eukprot:3433855-Alexandrium_andersonii.AAC.1